LLSLAGLLGLAVRGCVCVMRGLAWVRWFGAPAAHDASRKSCVGLASNASFRLFVQGSLAFIVLLGLTWRSKGRAASWRFCRLVFYQALGLRPPSVNGAPLSFTLGLLRSSFEAAWAFTPAAVVGPFNYLNQEYANE